MSTHSHKGKQNKEITMKKTETVLQKTTTTIMNNRSTSNGTTTSNAVPVTPYNANTNHRIRNVAITCPYNQTKRNTDHQNLPPPTLPPTRMSSASATAPTAAGPPAGSTASPSTSMVHHSPLERKKSLSNGNIDESCMSMSMSMSIAETSERTVLKDYGEQNNRPNHHFFGADLVRNPDGTPLLDHNQNTITIAKMLSTKPLRHELATRPGPGNRKLTYLSGDSVTRTLNDIFGFDGWCLEVKETKRESCEKDQKGRYNVSYTSIVRVTHRISGAFKEDCGAGDAIDRSLGTAVSNALKGSVTDAMKRAVRHFGDKLGNSLYESKFSVNNAPRTLVDALNQYEIDRAKKKFGFQKDQKPQITNGSSASSPLPLAAAASNNETNTKSMIIKTSNLVSNGNNTKPLTNSANTVNAKLKLEESKIQPCLQPQPNHNIYQHRGPTVSTAHQRNPNNVVQQQHQYTQQNTSSSCNNTLSTHLKTTSNNHASTPNAGGLSRFQQPPTSIQKNLSKGLNVHNVYQQRQSQQHNHQNLNSNASNMTATSRVANPIQHRTNQSFAHGSLLNTKTSNNQNQINMQKGNINLSNGMSTNKSQILARPTTARGHTSTFPPSLSKENTNLNGKRILANSNNGQLQNNIKKTSALSVANNPYASKKV